MYGPLIDGDLVPDYMYRLFAQGRFTKVPSIMGDDVNGGTVFVPKSTANISQSNTFLKDQFNTLTLAQLAQINSMYPFAGTPVFPGAGAYWRKSRLETNLQYRD